jgi:hypothetical protein
MMIGCFLLSLVSGPNSEAIRGTKSKPVRCPHLVYDF